MEIILNIPAQPATLNKERLAALSICNRNGTLLLTERDSKKPAQFYLGPNDIFPWAQFFEKLIIAWQLGDYTGVPQAFKPQKRIPQFVIDGFLKESLKNQLKILATLRNQGFFPALNNK